MCVGMNSNKNWNKVEEKCRTVKLHVQSKLTTTHVGKESTLNKIIVNPPFVSTLLTPIVQLE